MPAPKSIQAKEAKGTAKSTRTKAIAARLDGVNFESGVPAPPDGSNLNAEETRIYYEIGKRISVSMPMLAIDSYTLTLLATWVALANDAKAKLSKSGAIQVYAKTGARAVSPELLLFEKASLNISKLGAAFGISPKDRILLLGSLAPKNDKHDPLDDF